MLRPDPARVLVRPFFPATSPQPAAMLHARLPATEPGRPADVSRSRIETIIDHVVGLDPAAVAAELRDVVAGFGARHADLLDSFADRYCAVGHHVPVPPDVADEDRRLLIGAYFSLEYSFEAAALFNPSMVAHPDQSGAGPGEVRFVLSLRGVGEGHISSICFRSGTVDADGGLRIDPPGQSAAMPSWNGAAADQAYDVTFPPESLLADRVLFPMTPKQRNGLEDARFVRFVEQDGRVAYYATYTAYSGQEIAPELLRTEDFRRFEFLPLTGNAVHNKGMALFPRRVGGQYCMLARLDGQTIQLTRSDDLRIWNDADPVMGPAESWEFLQIGNCGSPIELPEGWLMLTHGVGAMRQYSIGAALLDLDDPTRVLARLRTPLLCANAAERDGYVPNVVYSCGGMVHGDRLVLPYAMSDSATSFATVPVAQLLAAMS